MPYKLGDPTFSVFDKGIHGNDIHVEFVAGAAIEIGQPIKLDVDGTVLPAAVDEPLTNIIGTSIHSRALGEFVTVATRFRCTINAKSGGIFNAGGVKYAGYSSGFNTFVAQVNPLLIVGYSLGPATGADEDIVVGII